MTRDEAIKALAALGETAEEVAAALKAKGIKGTRHKPCHCPLAKLIGGYVSGLYAYVEEEGFELSKACKDFTTYFDLGSYPELHQDLPGIQWFTYS